MLSLFRRAFGGGAEAKKKRESRKRRKVENVYEKMDLKRPPPPKPERRRDSKIIVNNDLYHSIKIEEGQVVVTTSHTNEDYDNDGNVAAAKVDEYEDDVLEDRMPVGDYDEVVNYDEIDLRKVYDVVGMEYDRERALTLGRVAKQSYGTDYNHVADFRGKRRIGNYDTLERDNDAANRFYQRSQSVNDVREDNLFFLKTNSPAMNPVPRPTANYEQHRQRVEFANQHSKPMRNSQTQQNGFVRTRLTSTNDISVLRSPSITVQDAINIFRNGYTPRNYSWTRYPGRLTANRGLEVYRPPASFDRAISRENVSALKVHFDERPPTESMTLPRKNHPRRILRNNQATNDKDELSKSDLFIAMKNRLSSAS